MANGRKLLQQKELEKALQVFETVLKRDKSNAEAFFHAGTIYLRLNQVPKGIEYIERSAKLAPDNVKLQFILAKTYEGAKLNDKAIAEYRKVMEMAPNTPDAKESEKRSRILTGKQYGEKGEYEQALQAFSSVLEDYPNDVPTLLDMGVTLTLMGRIDQSQSALEKALALQPNNGLAHRYLGDLFEKKGDLQQSVTQYEQALKLFPRESPIYSIVEGKLALDRGAQFMAKGKMADAQREYEKALALDPHNPAARFNLATIYHDLGKLSSAEEMLLSLSRDNPADIGIRVRLGALYLEQGKLQEAARELGAVAAKGGDSLEVQQAKQLLDTIRSAVGQGQIGQISDDDRIAVFRSLLEKNPDDRQTWLNLGLLYMQLRRHDEAIEAFENVVRLDANDARAQAILGGLYDESNEPDKALKAYGIALGLEKDPKQRERLEDQLDMVKAKKAYNEGRLEEAKQQFRAILSKNNDNYVAHFFLALIYARTEKLDEAAAEYQEVLRIVPGHVLARLSLAAIHEQTGHEEQAVTEYRAVAISGVPGLSDTAKKRLAALLKRIGGFTFNAGYALNFDSNSNLSPTNPTQEVRSDTSGTISYQRKISGRRIYWGLRFSPSYSIYHKQQFDFLQTQISPFINGVWRGLDLSANYSYSESDGVLNEQHYNRSNSIYAESLKRFKMRALLPFLASEEQRGSAPSAWRINATYRTFRSSTSPIFDANSYSIGFLLNQGSSSGWSWTGVYTFVNNDNILTIGNDFAFSSNGINLQLSKTVSQKLTVNGGYGFTYSQYTNPDSVTRFTEKRINKFHSLSLGLNYNVNEKLRLYCNYNYQRNNSNLPTGFILSTENVSTAVGIQSPSLGDYHKYGITAGLALNF